MATALPLLLKWRHWHPKYNLIAFRTVPCRPVCLRRRRIRRLQAHGPAAGVPPCLVRTRAALRVRLPLRLVVLLLELPAVGFSFSKHPILKRDLEASALRTLSATLGLELNTPSRSFNRGPLRVRRATNLPSLEDPGFHASADGIAIVGFWQSIGRPSDPQVVAIGSFAPVGTRAQ
jgi:hypothetical protein